MNIAIVILVLNPFVLQCVIDLSYSPKEASVLIETLSIHWDKVLDHLNRVSRLPSYRFHMREVCFVSFRGFIWGFSRSEFSFNITAQHL